ncbi:hypothetical protein GBN24_04290 [Plesiomonas shigelloides]|uniref:hypothetical protein n=1 Tax=Plesiomonas shigelloides TaxID=703 RepID=UPI001262A419|nr:hypothetical protein [Plesiomonas shigelloides]KAB7693158.1 hypothetical protein GBN24_04290 [Plesiomonas shigelloides]
MTILFSVISGVIVFITCQFFLKLVLEPIVSLKESLGLLSAFCLKNQAKLINANATLEQQQELNKIISTILSKKESIPFYKQLAKILRLPNDSDLLEGCKNMNLIAYNMYAGTCTEENKSITYSTIYDGLK